MRLVPTLLLAVVLVTQPGCVWLFTDVETVTSHVEAVKLVKIETSHPGAKVFVDGEYYGESPCHLRLDYDKFENRQDIVGHQASWWILDSTWFFAFGIPGAVFLIYDGIYVSLYPQALGYETRDHAYEISIKAPDFETVEFTLIAPSCEASRYVELVPCVSSLPP